MCRLLVPYGHSWQRTPHQKSQKQSCPAISTCPESILYFITSLHHGFTYPMEPRCPAEVQKYRQENRTVRPLLVIAPAAPELNSPPFPPGPSWSSLLPGLPAPLLTPLLIRSPASSKSECFETREIIYLLAYDPPQFPVSQRRKSHTCGPHQPHPKPFSP